jgi:hypothetical protein
MIDFIEVKTVTNNFKKIIRRVKLKVQRPFSNDVNSKVTVCFTRKTTIARLYAFLFNDYFLDITSANVL